MGTSVQQQSVGLEMVFFGALTNIPFPQLRNAAPPTLPLACRIVTTPESSSSCSDPAFSRFDSFLCGVRCVSTYDHLHECLQDLKHWHHRHMKLCVSHGHGMKSESLFRDSRVWWALTTNDQDTVCKTECVRACEHAKRLLLKRRLVRLDDVGHVLVTTCMSLDSNQMRHTECQIVCKFVVSLRRLVRRAWDQDCRTTISSAIYCLWFSMGGISKLRGSSHRWQPSSQNTQQVSKLEFRVRYDTRVPSPMKSTNTIKPALKGQILWCVKKTSTLGADNDDVRHDETCKYFLRCFSPQCRGFGAVGRDTSACPRPPETKSSKAECKDTCRVQKPSHRLSGEGLPCHPELLWLARHLQISYSVNPSVEYLPIFHMLFPSWTKFSSFLGPPPNKVSYWFPLRTKIDAQVSQIYDLYYVRNLRSGGRSMSLRLPET